MGQSLIRYCAVVCIAAGGLFMGGTGAVAFADDPQTGESNVESTVDDNTLTPGSTTLPPGFGLPKWLQFPGFNATAGPSQRVGVMAPPVMNLPTTLEPITAGRSAMRPSPTITLPFVIDTLTRRGGRQPAGRAVVPDSSGAEAVGGLPAEQEQNRKPAATTDSEPPTIDLTTLAPSDVPTGPPLRIKNPLRELLPADFDPHKPLMPQLLPTPLVAILEAVAKQIPLAGLIISPVLEFVPPPFFSDVVIPLLLSDIVVPTPAITSVAPTSIPTGVSASKLAATVMLGDSAPPVELAPMGMDVFQAPVPPKESSPLRSLALGKPEAPRLPDNKVNALSQPFEYRAGYSDYLRNAGLAQITAIAVPGAAAILLFSLGGGFIGYRQARAGHVIRAEGIARFLS